MVEKEIYIVYFRDRNKQENFCQGVGNVIQILIIADDDTGMLDAGAPFAKRGIRTEAIIQEPSAALLKESEAVVAVVSTKTRHAPRDQAYQRVYKIARIALEAGVPILYKKTDSALRGPVGAELEALMDAADDNLSFFPAYPDAGRTTVKGVQYVDGVPVGESVFSKDELNPVVQSDIPDILRQTTDAAAVLAGERESQRSEKHQITIFDAENTEAFHRTVKEFLEKTTPRLLAGCAGLACELADLLSFPKSVVPKFPVVKRLFVLCGSSNPVTAEQVDYAAAHGFTRFTLKKEDMTGKEQLLDIRKACVEGKPIILEMEYLLPETVGWPGIKKQELGNLIIESVNQVLLQCMDVLPDYVLFLTGGDTLGTFIQRSGCERIQILGEFSPGVIKNLFYINGKKVYAFSKSGGFGNKELLLQLFNET